jgi:hypothetical protein
MEGSLIFMAVFLCLCHRIGRAETVAATGDPRSSMFMRFQESADEDFAHAQVAGDADGQAGDVVAGVRRSASARRSSRERPFGCASAQLGFEEG